MRPGDKFIARARWGETYETRYPVEGEFLVLLVREEEGYLCSPAKAFVTRLDRQEPVPFDMLALVFKRDADGLLRELNHSQKGFKGAHGFKQVEA